MAGEARATSASAVEPHTDGTSPGQETQQEQSDDVSMAGDDGTAATGSNETLRVSGSASAESRDSGEGGGQRQAIPGSPFAEQDTGSEDRVFDATGLDLAAEFPRILQEMSENGAEDAGYHKFSTAKTLPVNAVFDEAQLRGAKVEARRYFPSTRENTGGVVPLGIKHRCVIPPKPQITNVEGRDDSEAVDLLEQRLRNKDGLCDVYYQVDIDLEDPDLRQLLQLPDDESPIKSLKGDHLPPERDIPGINTPFGYRSTSAFGVFPLHQDDYKLHAVNLLYQGEKIWIIIPAACSGKLEDLIRSSLPKRSQQPCTQFVRHRPMFIPPAVLKSNGIDFHVVRQKAGQGLVVWPGAYHQGFSLGPTVAEAINYASSKPGAEVYVDCTTACNNGSNPVTLEVLAPAAGGAAGKKRKQAPRRSHVPVTKKAKTALANQAAKRLAGPPPRPLEDILLHHVSFMIQPKQLEPQLRDLEPGLDAGTVSDLTRLFYGIGSPDALFALKCSFETGMLYSERLPDDSLTHTARSLYILHSQRKHNAIQGRLYATRFRQQKDHLGENLQQGRRQTRRTRVRQDGQDFSGKASAEAFKRLTKDVWPKVEDEATLQQYQKVLENDYKRARNYVRLVECFSEGVLLLLPPAGDKYSFRESV